MEDDTGMAFTAHFPDASQMRRADVVQGAEAVKHLIRRRPTQTQGQALEKLGRAIEYLMDSRMAFLQEPTTKADADALEILMRLNRWVFAECEEIVPVRRRLKVWVLAKLHAH
jgi:hypothetical protein